MPRFRNVPVPFLALVFAASLSGCQKATSYRDEGSREVSFSSGKSADTDEGRRITGSGAEPITFSTKGLEVSIEKQVEPADQSISVLSSDMAVDISEACGRPMSPQHLRLLKEKFGGETSINYLIQAKDPRRYFSTPVEITVLPNKMSYGSVTEAKNGLGSCESDDARTYPNRYQFPFNVVAVNRGWVAVDTTSCNPSTENFEGCDAARKAIIPTIRFR